ncbi:MAG: hypothetical protein A2234_06080 [Elusimicrobia bacterium RIFOXYA2_FULL_58_8]|nr:MAG: hypothetical protein A2285_04400 [Elusimicrobia bacterium RIFOXYA12_FULL_57_11]OGS17025.1 MAG: hypothetical protein A2234_06080 [Elusimicrobia bacterium RIFOXYA2_FULL_58_8]
MVLIAAGSFWMGSPEGEGAQDEYPRHRVHLDAFYIDKYPVTAGKYKLFCEAAGEPMPKQPQWSTDLHPVVNLDWEGADAYCKWAGTRLPTEAEWEKAARGGADTTYSFGDHAAKRKFLSCDSWDILGEYAWCVDRSGRLEGHPVGQKKPNQYGLYDMPGAVWEWVADWYAEDYYKDSPRINPRGPEEGIHRSLRGGMWDFVHDDLRPAGRSGGYLGGNYGLDSIGFRCALSLQDAQ